MPLRPAARRGAIAVAGLAALLAGGGCTGDRLATIEAPAGADWLALVTKDAESGQVERVSELRRADQVLRFMAEHGLRTEILAWSDEAIRALLETGSEPSPEPLSVASGCARVLPPPGWRWTVEASGAGEVVEAAPGDAPRLTAGWLERSCSRAIDDFAYSNIRCIDHGCRFEMRGTRCGLELDYRACIREQISVVAGPGDTLCAVTASGVSCPAQLRDEAGGEMLELECPGPCTIELHRPQPSPFDVRTATVMSLDPSLVARTLAPENSRIGNGPVRDLAVLDDRLVVSTTTGSWSGGGCRPGDPQHGQVVLMDLDLRILRTATAPDCLDRIARDPIGPGFIGVHGIGRRFVLQRFDEDARATTAREIAELPPVVGGAYQAIDVVVRRPGRELGVLFQDSIAGEDERMGLLVRFDASTLSEIARTPLFETSSWSLVDAGANGYAAGDDNENRVLLLSDSGTLPIGFYEVPIQMYLGAVAYHEPTERFLGAVGSGSRAVMAGVGVRIARPTGEVRQASFFEKRAGMPTAFGPWAAEPQLELVAVSFSDSWPLAGQWTAAIALLDPMAERFLTGMSALGPGVARDLEAHADGTVYALLPWVGQIARIRRVSTR